jgi:hypothetical protein
VGTYSPLAKVGDGYVWDDVLEYRVWCHPERGSRDLADGSDYYHPFATYAEALAFSRSIEGAKEPLALIRQREYIAEPNPGEYLHVKGERITEWPVGFLSRPRRRTQNTIPDFLSPLSPRVQSERIDVAGPVVAKQKRNIIGVQSKPESRSSCEISADQIHDPFLLTVRN